FGEADCFEILGAMNAVGVEVEDGEDAAVVDVEQDESRATDRLRISSQSKNQTADELRLSCAQVSVQRDAFAAVKRLRKFRRDAFGFFDAVGLVDQKVCSQPLGSRGVSLPSCSRKTPGSLVKRPIGVSPISVNLPRLKFMITDSRARSSMNLA